MIKFNHNTLDITIVQGDTATFSFIVRDKKALKSLVENGDSVFFTVREKLDSSIILQKEITTFGENGKIKVPISSEETKEIKEGNYIYDLKSVRTGDLVDTLNPNRPYSYFTVKKGVK